MRPEDPCTFCEDWEGCVRQRPSGPAPQDCFRPRRRLDLDRVREHFVDLRRRAGASVRSLPVLERRLLAHLARAAARYSNILEFSFSARGQVGSPYRFSFSFPAFGEGRRDAEVASCLGLVEPFGRKAQRMARSVLRYAHPPVVVQILFGIDATSDVLRIKLYLQLAPGLANGKRTLLARVLPPAGRRGFADALERLHLLGVDFDRHGAAAYKLYYLRERVPASSLVGAFPRAAPLAQLVRRSGLATFHDVVLISRHGRDGELQGPGIAEIDLGLRANGLAWGDVAACWATRRVGRAFQAFQRSILTRHRWAATRVSLPVSGSAKLNVYYVLLDPPSRAGPRACATVQGGYHPAG